MPRRWEPSAEDGMSLAAFRWFANSIENFAIELYATDRKSYPEIEGILRDTLKEMKRTRKAFMVSEEENGCPDGYVLCNGVCAPSCDFEAGEVSPAQATARGQGKGKKKR